MNFRASVDFISDKKDTAEEPFRGLQIRKYAYVLCDYAKSGLFSQSLIGELSTCFCCFLLEGDVAWEERHLSDEVPSCCDLSEETDVFNKIEEFLRGMMKKEYNVGKNILMFDMTIRKMVTIPDEQLKSWNSWYKEKNRSDPNFEYGFRQAIRRSRTAAELIEELRLASRGTSLKSSISQDLEVVEVEESSSERICSICLEEFLPHSQAIKLRCCHVFDENFIEKWLQESQACPSCRFPVQMVTREYD